MDGLVSETVSNAKSYRTICHYWQLLIKTMPKSATNIARELLGCAKASLEDLEIHQFGDDAEAHDDEALQRLYADFEAKFERAQSELSASYGKPVRTGDNDDEDIPLNGIGRFAVWDVENKLLYLAFAHEDRGLPVLLMLGTNLR
jgi:hypothetical protein